MKKFILSTCIFFIVFSVSAQPERWQQHARYSMVVDMDVTTNKLSAKQTIVYSNSSPDTLKRVFYHLYWNAFQPNSMMDVRSRRQGGISAMRDQYGNELPDWDGRVEDRILHLKENEIGYQKVSFVKLNGRNQEMKLHETILEVLLDRPILPGTKVNLELEWTSQVPLQVRRSGRDNPATDVRYTMTQWYPKLSEYDVEGWHPNPYVAREFYGVWSDFDVKININKKYALGGSGVLQNPNTVGFGYQEKGKKVPAATGDKLQWHFKAANVHDFAWAADPDYKHIIKKIPGGPEFHVLYNATPTREAYEELSPSSQALYGNSFENYIKNWDANWETLANAAVIIYPFVKEKFGEYPYAQYSFIQGGDGAMEYPNCTMLKSFGLGSAIHEFMHSWYQGMMGTNESLHAWMDEGFTEWATNLVEEYYRQKFSLATIANNPAAIRKSDSLALVPPAYHQANYSGYLRLARSGREEPLTIHADHANTNYGHQTGVYSKGAVFVEQLGYIVGAEVRDRIIKEYYRQWRFKHPTPNDFMRIAENVSDMKLDWYKMYWINTTRTIDYKIDSLWDVSGQAKVRLRNIGLIPMPIDVKFTFRDGSTEWHYIPLNLMYGSKPAEAGQENRKVYEEWKWTHPVYEVISAKKLSDIISVEIDPSHRMADIDRRNNRIELRWPN
ncbi:MAG: M1 family metallopeptidase [Flavisolibacter sp.]